MNKLFFIVAAIFFASCASENDIPDDIIPIDKMKLVTWDMMRAGEYARAKFGKDSLLITQKTTDAFKQVFALYGIEKEKFYKSISYYEAHPDKNKILFDSISAFAEQKRLDAYQKLK